MTKETALEVIEALLKEVACDYCTTGVLNPKGDALDIVNALSDRGYELSKAEKTNDHHI